MSTPNKKVVLATEDPEIGKLFEQFEQLMLLRNEVDEATIILIEKLLKKEVSADCWEKFTEKYKKVDMHSIDRRIAVMICRFEQCKSLFLHIVSLKTLHLCDYELIAVNCMKIGRVRYIVSQAAWATAVFANQIERGRAVCFKLSPPPPAPEINWHEENFYKDCPVA